MWILMQLPEHGCLLAQIPSWLPVTLPDRQGVSHMSCAICASPAGVLGYFGLFHMKIGTYIWAWELNSALH